MSVEHELTVVAEPETLLPLRAELIKYAQVDGAPSDSEDGGTSTQLDRRVCRYVYE